MPQGFIYLRVEPEVAYERTKKRNRAAEKSMTLGYLKQIHQHHDDFLLDKESILSDLLTIPVLVIDGNTDFENNPAVLKRQCAAVEDFIINTQAHVPHKGANTYRSPRVE